MCFGIYIGTGQPQGRDRIGQLSRAYLLLKLLRQLGVGRVRGALAFLVLFLSARHGYYKGFSIVADGTSQVRIEAGIFSIWRERIMSF